MTLVAATKSADHFGWALATWLGLMLGLSTAGTMKILASDNDATPAGFELKTTAFTPGGEIPKKFACDGLDVSPALGWVDPPARTQSFALIADDPDAPGGTWVHWVAYDLPASARQLPEGVPAVDEMKGGGRQGLNDFPRMGYGGPCPPPGKPHRYFFRLYALDAKVNLKAGATRSALEEAMKGHILGHAELMGRYHR